MDNLNVTTAQFENKSGDKDYNLSIINKLSKEASQSGSKLIAFHECSITGYTFAQRLSRRELLEIAEVVPDGPSVKALQTIATTFDIVICAGLFEKDESENIYNTYVCVSSAGVLAKYRKIHPFISKYLSPGNEYVVFEVFGWKCGILICYDNNVIENVRATALLGAEIILMPHVTMCTPSTRPGAGFVDPKLWEARERDPTTLRAEFDSLKGRQWLMKWLPARAYDNGIYVVFSNPIGMDDDQLKNGCSMILDPFGDILGECRKIGDQISSATLTRERLSMAGGKRYREARRVDLFREVLGKDHEPVLKVNWLEK